MVDLMFADHGTLAILVAITPAGQDWVAEHIPKDAQTFGGGIVIEHRYVADIMRGALADGLEIGARRGA